MDGPEGIAQVLGHLQDCGVDVFFFEQAGRRVQHALGRFMRTRRLPITRLHERVLEITLADPPDLLQGFFQSAGFALFKKGKNAAGPDTDVLGAPLGVKGSGSFPDRGRDAGGKSGVDRFFPPA